MTPRCGVPDCAPAQRHSSHFHDVLRSVRVVWLRISRCFLSKWTVFLSRWDCVWFLLCRLMGVFWWRLSLVVGVCHDPASQVSRMSTLLGPHQLPCPCPSRRRPCHYRSPSGHRPGICHTEPAHLQVGPAMLEPQWLRMSCRCRLAAVVVLRCRCRLQVFCEANVLCHDMYVSSVFGYIS